MIISRTPFRISFVGGGTDLRAFYHKEFGQVLSTSIDKYIYVAVKRQTEIVDFKYRINWSKVEFRNKINDIEHPIIREALRMLEIDFPCEVTTFADIPAKSGLGSSSSFSVGLLNALYALKGQMVNKETLASQAAEIEIDILKRNMGKQDHYAAAYGGMNIITFNQDESVTVDPVIKDRFSLKNLQEKLLLFFTGNTRDASEILKSQIEKTEDKFETLAKMRDLVPELKKAIEIGDYDGFGSLLHKNWLLKKSITNDISDKNIDEYYQRALDNGARGGKLLGAGGGGFLCFYVNEANQKNVIKNMFNLYNLDFEFEDVGTQITYYDQ